MEKGRVQCFECQAQTRMFVQLRCIAKYDTVESTQVLHVDFSTIFVGAVTDEQRPPETLINNQKGDTMISVAAPLLTEAEVASSNLRFDVLKWFSAKRMHRPYDTQKVLFQSFSADAIPLYRVEYKFNKLSYHFWVVGSHRNVWEKDYPHNCCCCRCVIQ